MNSIRFVKLNFLNDTLLLNHINLNEEVTNIHLKNGRLLVLQRMENMMKIVFNMISKKHELFERIRITNTDKCFDNEEFLQFHYPDFFGTYSSKDFQHTLFIST